VLLQEKRLPVKTWQFVLLALCLFDLCAVDTSLFTIRPAKAVLAESEQVAKYLSEQPGDFRLYSPSYSLPQQTSALYELDLASGVDPLQLLSYADYLQAASGIPIDGYSVVLPPLVEEPKTADITYSPDAKLLGLLNVGYVLSAYPLQADGLDEIATFGETLLYKNLYSQPRAWVETGIGIRPAMVESKSPNFLRITANGPGLLALAEISYPGWRAWIDDKPVAILAKEGLLRSVHLEPGDHEIVFRYFPKVLFIGFGLMVFGALLILLIGRGRS
jgi:hypothetical protein